MIFKPTKLSGVFEIEIETNNDARGFFARTWCQEEFQHHGLDTRLAQCSISFNAVGGTLRGMHFQAEPYPEAKVVRCTKGAIFDVAIDLRPGSPTIRQWIGVELTAANHRMLYVPPGCAHGLLTLQDETEVLYNISEFYHPELASGVRWNDPAIGIVWPGEVRVISERDQQFPDLRIS